MLKVTGGMIQNYTNPFILIIMMTFIHFLMVKSKEALNIHRAEDGIPIIPN